MHTHEVHALKMPVHNMIVCEMHIHKINAKRCLLKGSIRYTRIRCTCIKVHVHKMHKEWDMGVWGTGMSLWCGNCPLRETAAELYISRQRRAFTAMLLNINAVADCNLGYCVVSKIVNDQECFEVDFWQVCQNSTPNDLQIYPVSTWICYAT